MVFESMRMILPYWLISMTSDFSVTCAMPTTLPLRSVVLTLITPLPPRLVRRYSSAGVRLPYPFSVTERMSEPFSGIRVARLRVASHRPCLRRPWLLARSGLRRGGHADDVIFLAQVHAAHAGGVASHGADVVFVEANRLAIVRSEEDDLLAVGERGGDQFVALSMLMAMMPRDITWEKSFTSVFFTVPLRVAKKTYLPSSSRSRTASMVRTVSPGCKADQVADVLALAGGADVGNLVHLQPVHASRVGEDQDVGVGRGDEQMLDEILVARLHAGAPGAAAALHAVGRDRACASCSRSG